MHVLDLPALTLKEMTIRRRLIIPRPTQTRKAHKDIHGAVLFVHDIARRYGTYIVLGLTMTQSAPRSSPFTSRPPSTHSQGAPQGTTTETLPKRLK